MNLIEKLNLELTSQFDILAEAGKIYDPRNWEQLWPNAPARWVLKFLLSASIASADSTCLNRHTGACLVDIKIQKNGSSAPFALDACFNGAPTGITPCTKIGYCKYKKAALDNFCREKRIQLGEGLPDEFKQEFRRFKESYLTLCQAVHAEENAIYFSPVKPQGKMLFATTNPCPRCARAIVQNGIAAVVYSVPYKTDSRGMPSLFEETTRLFRESHTPCVQIPTPNEYIEAVFNECRQEQA